MTIRSYRDLEVWQKGMDLAAECYRITEGFPGHERYGLASQLQRAAASVPANIAEGQARQHTKEFLQFLSVASGSLAEVETYLLLAVRLNYLPGACRPEAHGDEMKGAGLVSHIRWRSSCGFGSLREIYSLIGANI